MPIVVYDEKGNIVVTTRGDYMEYDDQGRLLKQWTDEDYAAFEKAGGQITDLFTVRDSLNPVKGAKFWPHPLPQNTTGWKVERAGKPGAKHIRAIHDADGKRHTRKP